MSLVARIGVARILTAMALLTLSLVGRAAQAAPAQQAGMTVQILDYKFEPKTLTVPVGTKVTWQNSGKVPHTATSDTGVFDIGNLDAGASGSFTFNTAGTYPYYCKYHGNKGGAGMSGTIVVTAAQTAPQPTTAPAGSAPTGSLKANNQPVSGDAITVAEVTSSAGGWVAVHVDDNGKPGKVVGFAPVKAGTSSNVKVTLNPAPKAGDKYWPMLHVDAGVKGTYEFPGADVPVIVNGQVVMMEINITGGVPASLPNTGIDNSAISLLAGIALVALAAGLSLSRGARKRAGAR